MTTTTKYGHVTSLRMLPPLMRAIDKLAERDGRTRAAQIRHILKFYIKTQKQQAKK